MSPSSPITASASLAVVTPAKVTPSGLSSDLAAAFRPLTNSFRTRGSSLMIRTRLTGFFIGRERRKADYTFRPSLRRHELAHRRIRDKRRDARGEAVPAQRLGGAPVRSHVGVRLRRPHAVLALRISRDLGRGEVRRGGRPAEGNRADGLQLPAELREGQRAGGEAGARRGAPRNGRQPAIALRRSARRLLCRAALFLWMTCLSAMRSITPLASENALRAAALSPALIDRKSVV